MVVCPHVPELRSRIHWTAVAVVCCKFPKGGWISWVYEVCVPVFWVMVQGESTGDLNGEDRGLPGVDILRYYADFENASLLSPPEKIVFMWLAYKDSDRVIFFECVRFFVYYRHRLKGLRQYHAIMKFLFFLLS